MPLKNIKFRGTWQSFAFRRRFEGTQDVTSHAILENHLSVRIEQKVKQWKKKEETTARYLHLQSLLQELEERVGTKVVLLQEMKIAENLLFLISVARIWKIWQRNFFEI